MSVSQSSELNYNANIAQHSSMRMSRVLPLSGTGDVSLTSSPQEIQFELPNKVYNLSKSLLEFNLNVPLTVTKVTNLWSLGQSMIDRMSIYTREGVYLCDLTSFAQFSRAVTPYVTKLEDMLDNDNSARGSATKAAAQYLGKSSNNFRSDQVAGTAPSGLASKNGDRIGASSSEADPPVEVAPAYESNSVSYTSHNAFITSADGGAINVEYSIPMSEFHHSIASVNRVMYFGQSLILRVHLNSLARIGWTSDAYDVANAADISAATVSGLRVLLAVETNPVVVQGLVNRVQSSGLQVIVPYVYSYLYNSPAGSSSAVQQRVNAGFGQRLLNIYHTMFNRLDKSATSMDVSNGHAKNAKLVSYQTSLDNNNLQEYLVECDKNQDYQLLKPILKGSCIQNLDDYRHSRVTIDSWRKGPSSEWKDRDATELDGLPLESERIWAINQNTVNEGAGAGNFRQAQYRQYSFFVVQRTLTIAPNGQIVVS